MAIEWKDEYSIGVAHLDDQHKGIFEALNRLEELLNRGRCGDAQTRAALDHILDYTSQHFADEEACMIRHLCPAAKANENAHSAFMRAMAGYQKEIESQGMAESILRELHMVAEGWFLSHICSTDSHLRACVSSRGSGS